jgi:SAM-dependent methyltransferase
MKATPREENVADTAAQTKKSFGEKWTSSADFQIGGISAFDSDTLNWICTRNGFNDVQEFGEYVSQFETCLDAGCGNGRILGLLSEVVSDSTKLYGLDISAADVARANLKNAVEEIYTADLMDIETFGAIPRPDFIYCQEVLHHTTRPDVSFANLAKVLRDNGEIAIYVYKKKAPLREFTDDFVRSRIEALPHIEAMELARDFAAFGRALSELKTTVEVPELRLLEIPAGNYDIQRLLYHFFVKCYWNSELSENDNTMINFDWYHPSLCSRHTLDEVQNWFIQNNLAIVHSYVDEYGITVRGRKS